MKNVFNRRIKEINSIKKRVIKESPKFFWIESELVRRESSMKDLDKSRVVIFSELMIEERIWGIILNWGLEKEKLTLRKKSDNPFTISHSLLYNLDIKQLPLLFLFSKLIVTKRSCFINYKRRKYVKGIIILFLYKLKSVR